MEKEVPREPLADIFSKRGAEAAAASQKIAILQLSLRKKKNCRVLWHGKNLHEKSIPLDLVRKNESGGTRFGETRELRGNPTHCDNLKKGVTEAWHG